jgi:hypothetical protein
MKVKIWKGAGTTMSNFIHAKEYLDDGDVVIVNCDHQCNVLVMDDINFSHYQNRGQFHYYGGWRTHFPTRIVVPHSGHWNTVIDLAGGRADIRYNISYLKGAA